MKNPDSIYVARYQRIVGSALIRPLRAKGHHLFALRTHPELDLTNRVAVSEIFATQKFGQGHIAAARVGGMHANTTYPAESIYSNLMVQANAMACPNAGFCAHYATTVAA